MDHGTEFVSKTLDEWRYRRGVKLDFVHPGKPAESGMIDTPSGNNAANSGDSRAGLLFVSMLTGIMRLGQTMVVMNPLARC